MQRPFRTLAAGAPAAPAHAPRLPSRARRGWLQCTGTLALGGTAHAQAAYPERAVRVVIPNAPGSSVDTIGRLACGELARQLGQPFTPDNRAGAAGAIGVELARVAAPDGYTLLAGSSSAISVAPLIQRSAAYEPLRDFDLVSLVAVLPNVLVCHPALPVRSVEQLVAWARARGDDAKMASAGVGSASHLAGAALQAAAGFRSLHVPYKGGSQGVASVVSGETDWVLTPAPAAMALVHGGRLRLLGHSMAPGTDPLGGVPSIGTTVRGFALSGWIGLMAPRGLPAPVTDALVRAIGPAMQRPELQKAFESNGAVAAAGTPEAFRNFLAADIDANRRAIAAAGIPRE